MKTDLDGAFNCKNHDPNKQETSLQFCVFTLSKILQALITFTKTSVVSEASMKGKLDMLEHKAELSKSDW